MMNNLRTAVATNADQQADIFKHFQETGGAISGATNNYAVHHHDGHIFTQSHAMASKKASSLNSGVI